MRRWIPLAGLVALLGCGCGPERPKDPLMECLEMCSVNIGICQQGCKADAECNRSCAKTNELCTITCSKRK